MGCDGMRWYLLFAMGDPGRNLEEEEDPDFRSGCSSGQIWSPVGCRNSDIHEEEIFGML